MIEKRDQLSLPNHFFNHEVYERPEEKPRFKKTFVVFVSLW